MRWLRKPWSRSPPLLCPSLRPPLTCVPLTHHSHTRIFFSVVVEFLLPRCKSLLLVLTGSLSDKGFAFRPSPPPSQLFFPPLPFKVSLPFPCSFFLDAVFCSSELFYGVVPAILPIPKSLTPSKSRRPPTMRTSKRRPVWFPPSPLLAPCCVFRLFYSCFNV